MNRSEEQLHKNKEKHMILDVLFREDTLQCECISQNGNPKSHELVYFLILHLLIF